MNCIKNLLVISFLLLTTISFGFSEKEVNTKVKKVTVFTKGAQLSRIKKIQLTEGENVLRFTHLEQDINPNSIQLFGINGNENFTVIYTRYAVEESSTTHLDKRIEQINDSIQYIDGKLNMINSEIDNLTKEKKMVLSHNKIGNKEEASYTIRLAKLAAYYRESTNEIDQRIFELKNRMNKLNELKFDLNALLNEKTRKRYIGVIEAKIYANRAMNLELELNYMIGSVGWTPFYEIKSGGLNQPLKVVCKATINQNSGINWENVKLTLSTRKPEILSTIPKVHPWVLFFQQKRAVYSQNDQLINTGAISNTSFALESPTNINNLTTGNRTPDPTDYLAQFRHTTHKMINKEYKNERSYNVQGTNGIAVVVLDKFEMETEYIYYAVPKYDQNVYLLAEIADWQQHDLIPAFANIFLEGSYVGKLFIDPSRIEKNLELMLGKDDDIIVERKKINQNSEKQRKIVGSTETTEIGIEIVVHNRKKNDVQIVIKDQVPISNTEEIVVKINDISKAEIDDKTGTLTWKYTLASGTPVKHTILYEVRKPKNKRISGF